MSRQCEAHWGATADPSGHRRCHRKATKRAVDDDGETFYFCGHCARAFEGGMSEIHDLPSRKRSVTR